MSAVRNALLAVADALVPAHVAMLDRLTGYYVFQAASAAVTLGVPAALSGDPKSVEEIAARIGAPPDRTSRLLRALASHGIGKALPDGRYQGNRMSEVLDDRTEGSLAALLRFVGAPYYGRAWEQFATGLRNDVNPFVAAHGRALFEYLGTDAVAARNFADAMDALTSLDAPGIAAAFDFSSLPVGAKVCDVGGGHGPLLATILAQNPALRGVLFDGAAVLRDAPALLARYGVADRVELVTGSFFERVPSGCAV